MPDQDTPHQWSRSPATQAAARRAEGDAGPSLQHRDLPQTVERLEKRLDDLLRDYTQEWANLTQRVRAIEDRMYAPVVRIDTDETIDERGGVADALPEATTGSGNGTGLRTERVTLEVKHGSLFNASGWWWNEGMRLAFPLAKIESVRVVSTPGVGLTKEEIAVCVGLRDYCRGTWETWGRKDTLWLNRALALDALLARDAAAKIVQSAAWDEARDAYRGEIDRLKAERDAALNRAVDAGAAQSPPHRAFVFNEYQIANLRSLLQACGYGGKMIRSPLWVANTGDWVGEIYSMLPAVDFRPNADDEQLSIWANNYTALPMPPVVRLPRCDFTEPSTHAMGWHHAMGKVWQALDAAGVAWEVGE